MKDRRETTAKARLRSGASTMEDVQQFGDWLTACREIEDRRKVGPIPRCNRSPSVFRVRVSSPYRRRSSTVLGDRLYGMKKSRVTGPRKKESAVVLFF